MINLSILIIVLSFLSDNFLQTGEIKKNKHKDSTLLLVHCILYIVPMTIFAISVIHFTEQLWPAKWIALAFISRITLHWIFVRLASDAWDQNKRPRMIMYILTEQVILNIILLSSFKYLGGYQ